MLGLILSVIAFNGAVIVAYRLCRRDGENSISNSRPKHTALLDSRSVWALRTPPVRSFKSIPTKEFTAPVLPPALKNC